MHPSVHPEVAIPAVRETLASPLRPGLRFAALVLLFSGAAVYESTRISSLNVPDVWVHLRTGIWMIEHHSLPHAGLFSQHPSLQWNDTAWGFDLLLGMAYRIFDLRAIPILLMALKVAVAGITFLPPRSGGAGFWRACALSLIAQSVMAGLEPRWEDHACQSDREIADRKNCVPAFGHFENALADQKFIRFGIHELKGSSATREGIQSRRPLPQSTEAAKSHHNSRAAGQPVHRILHSGFANMVPMGM